MITREYVRPSVWSKYLEAKQIYPPKSNNCDNSIIETLKIKKAQKRNEALEHSSQWASDWADAYDRLIKEHQVKFNFADCHYRNNKAKIDALNDIIQEEARDYEKKVNEQTRKSNKTVLFIGATIMIVGLFIIVKR